jgi:hypothetical protein
VSTPAPATAPDRSALRLWWLVPEGAAAIVLLVLLGSGVAAGPGDVAAVAAARAARILEQVSPAEHHDHGHEVGAEDRVYCGVDVFGVDPPAAKVIDEVRTVYGYYFCAVGRPGVPYLESSRADGPIVVQLTNPPSVQIAAPGADYQDRVRAMMPDEYEALCFSGLPDASVADEVKRRYESEV